MKHQVNISTKKVQIDKSKMTILSAVAVASFLLAFSIVASRALYNRQSYQNRVIKEQKEALKQLNDNIVAVDELKVRYGAFVDRQENIISGNRDILDDRGGSNDKIILDALPSKYDFPALASSIEKLVKDTGLNFEGISGKDNEVEYNSEGSAAVQQPVELEIDFTAKGSYDNALELLNVLNKSIRPIIIKSLNIDADKNDEIVLGVKAKTYFQPERSLKIKEEIVK